MKIVEKKIIGSLGKDIEKMSELESKKHVISDEIETLREKLVKVDMSMKAILHSHLDKESRENYDCFSVNKLTGDIEGVVKMEPEQIASDLAERFMEGLLGERKGKKQELQEASKKRGRPRKQKTTDSVNDAPKKRGRPRKIPEPSEPLDVSDMKP